MQFLGHFLPEGICKNNFGDIDEIKTMFNERQTNINFVAKIVHISWQIDAREVHDINLSKLQNCRCKIIANFALRYNLLSHTSCIMKEYEIPFNKTMNSRML